jgi:hypothetical protein
MKFDDLSAVKVSVFVCWVVTPCGLFKGVIISSQGLYLHPATEHRKTKDKISCPKRDSNPRSSVRAFKAQAWFCGTNRETWIVSYLLYVPSEGKNNKEKDTWKKKAETSCRRSPFSRANCGSLHCTWLANLRCFVFVYDSMPRPKRTGTFLQEYFEFLADPSYLATVRIG